MWDLYQPQELEVYLDAKGVESQTMEMFGADERLRHQHLISFGKDNVVANASSWKAIGKMNVLIREQRCLNKEMEELELEVVTREI